MSVYNGEDENTTCPKALETKTNITSITTTKNVILTSSQNQLRMF